MRILVTGAAGFLGSHLVDALVAGGHEVVGLDNLHRGRREFVGDHIAGGRLELRIGDIRDAAAVACAVEGAALVIHLAAQSNVLGSLSDPDYSFSTNVVGTYNVLKAATAAGVRRMVFASSREVYGEPDSLPVREDASQRAKNAYGASKIAGEVYCRVWQQAGLDCRILRFANLYGPRDSDRVIPLWTGRALRGEDLVLYGGHQVIDFVWVGTAVQCLLAAIDREFTGPINVGSGRGTLLPDLAQRIIEITGSKSRVVRQPARDIEVGKFIADTSRMQSLLGVQPLKDPLECLAELARHIEDGVAA